MPPISEEERAAREAARLVRMVRNLKDESWLERWSAAYTLGEMGNKAATDPLIETIGDKDFDVRRAVIEALGKIREKKATPFVVRALDDKEKAVRLSAIRSLGRIKDKRAVEPLIDFLNNCTQKDFDLRKFIIHELGELGEPAAIKPLLEFSKDYSLQGYATRALVKIGDEAVEPLISALSDEDKKTRRWAAFSLGKIRPLSAVNPLIRALSDEDEEVQMESVRALGRIADKKAVTHLVKIMESSPYLQLEAALALKRLGDPRGKELLVQRAKERAIKFATREEGE